MTRYEMNLFYELLVAGVTLIELELDCDYLDIFPNVLLIEFSAPSALLFLGRVKSSLSLVSVNDKCLLSDDLLSNKTPRPLLAYACIEDPAAVNTIIAKTRILSMLYIVHQSLNSSYFYPQTMVFD